LLDRHAAGSDGVDGDSMATKLAEELAAEGEALTGSRVVAFVSDNRMEPDVRPRPS